MTHTDPTQRDDDGWSALDHAAGRGDVTLVERLLAAGADPHEEGPDGHTPYEIALAAGRRAVVEAIRAVDDRERTWQPYCRAYPEPELVAFDGWPSPAADVAGDAVLFLHHDLTVTRSVWPGEQVVFDQVTPAWERFCRDRLGFAVPDDRDLMPTDAEEKAG
ncbi:hypothetical protein GA0070558_12559 [Micromonospora haikouensis]|uniref:Uncharacterized protein n=1 Tax=Micromonospora haikouensis TaxID=686309 RepID=A0A1C4XI28_9ACTN|nr:ankyrin repeat domain-containing protein [Micromonospora haikouensis]SCF07821.1 hypothetical protein GA0070558_12559 [Micromonospora haikouensis]